AAARGSPRVALSRCRQGDPDVSTAVQLIGCVRGTVVAGCDRGDDRESEPGAFAGTSVVGAGEASERVRQEARFEPAALIADMELYLPAVGDRREGDVAGAVAQRILDEVAQRLFESRRIGVDMPGFVA